MDSGFLMDWKKAKRKVFRSVGNRWDYFPSSSGGKGVEQGVVESIYFSTISDRIKAKDIYDLFGCHRDVVEVVIPPRKNKQGKRYGFGKFARVEDVRMLAVRFDNILIEGKKIYANVPRFGRNSIHGGFGAQAKEEGRKASSGSFNGTLKEMRDYASTSGVVKGRSFTKAVLNGKNLYNKVSDNNDNGSPLLSFWTNKENKGSFVKAYMGEVLIPRSSYNIQTHSEVEGIFPIKVTPLGANLCLMEDMEEGFIRDLIGEGSTWWR